MYKKLSLFIIAITSFSATAQEVDKTAVLIANKVVVLDTINPRLKEKNYNRWSVNVNAGFNNPTGPFTPGYYSANTNFITDPVFNRIDFNVRKMFNTKFGIRLDLGFDNFSNVGKSMPFNNSMYTGTIQGVFNVHRALNWEEFTNTFGLQLHFGPGFSFLESDEPQKPNSTYKPGFFHFDNIYTVASGATLLIKFSERLAFNLDYSMMKNFSHHLNLDGKTKVDLSANRTGLNHTATAGITLYLGKKDKHADWFWEPKRDNSNELLARMESLESQLKDSNTNGFPDKWENYLKQNTTKNSAVVNNSIEGDQYYTTVEARNMINSQYVNVFFDFDQSKITTGTISSIFFLIKYLNMNPTLNVEVIGYADEFGNPAYNMKLSETRAKNVAEMIVRAGIDASRLKIVIKGEDNSVPKESELARQLVRRVAFRVY